MLNDRRIARFGGFFAVLCVLAGASTHVVTAARAPTDVRVRVYYAPSSASLVAPAALAAADTALASADLHVTWQLCLPRGKGGRNASRACETPITGPEFAVRILRADVAPDYRGNLPLGESLIVTSTGAGVLGTVYYDRVRWLAAAAGVDVQPVLGRAIAHELGHLLLATMGHRDEGLMRALWTRDELRRERTTDWIFAGEEGDAIHARVLEWPATRVWGTK